MVGVALVAIAIGASLLSLRLGYGELARRGDCATMTIAHLSQLVDDNDKAANVEPLLAGLDVDPDLAAALVTDAAGRPLVVHRNAMNPRAAAAAAHLLANGQGWHWDFIVADRMLATGQAARLAVAYDAGLAHRRALFQCLVYVIGALVALLATALALKIVFTRQLKPMQQLAAATTLLASERYQIEIPGLRRADEIGAMARAIETFKTRLVDRERLRSLADVETRQSTDRHARIGHRVDSFRSAIGLSLQEVGGLSDQMQVAADSLASIANQTTARAESAVAAIRQTSANVSSVADASGDLFSSIREIERQVEQTRSSVIAATRSTAETSSVIKGLFSKSEKIDEIIGLIQAIAAQTNLLSLNATIEAARAGESGRGFAVVAQEVKSLADQTARASQHVADHVRAIQEASSRAVEAIAGIDTTMAQAEQFSAVITVAVERQAAATAAISRNAAAAARSAEEAAGSMKTLAAAIGETDQSAAQVHQSATDVGQQAHDLSTTIDAFLLDTADLRDRTSAAA